MQKLVVLGLAALALTGCINPLDAKYKDGYEEGYEEGREQGREGAEARRLTACVRKAGGRRTLLTCASSRLPTDSPEKTMRRTRIAFATGLLYLLTAAAVADLPPVGAAPKGDAAMVASRIIKYNFPACTRVVIATRAPDGSIRATCDGIRYVVFTVFNA